MLDSKTRLWILIVINALLAGLSTLTSIGGTWVVYAIALLNSAYIIFGGIVPPVVAGIQKRQQLTRLSKCCHKE